MLPRCWDELELVANILECDPRVVDRHFASRGELGEFILRRSESVGIRILANRGVRLNRLDHYSVLVLHLCLLLQCLVLL